MDSRFGPTAVLGVPAEDRSDEVLARRLGIEPEEDGPGADTTGAGVAPAVRYKAADFTISRQRSW